MQVPADLLVAAKRRCTQQNRRRIQTASRHNDSATAMDANALLVTHRRFHTRSAATVHDHAIDLTMR